MLFSIKTSLSCGLGHCCLSRVARSLPLPGGEIWGGGIPGGVGAAPCVMMSLDSDHSRRMKYFTLNPTIKCPKAAFY